MTNEVQKLKNVLDFLAASAYEGVPGVLKFEGSTPGPCVGVTLCTHGNEPSGLAAADFLIKYFSYNKILRGTLFLVLNNLEATKRFFAATSEEDRRRSRYEDINMNRLPRDVLALKDDPRYEIMRSQELFPIWKRFTSGIDIHSTQEPTDPMIISRGKNFDLIKDLIQGFPIEILISNIDGVQQGIPSFALYGKPEERIPVFAIEAGQHADPRSYERAAACTLALLRNHGMIDRAAGEKISNHKFKEYLIESSIMFKNHSFDLVRDFRSFDAINKDELLAQNSAGEEIRAQFDGHIVFPTAKRGPDKDLSEEIAFLSKPMKERNI